MLVGQPSLGIKLSCSKTKITGYIISSRSEKDKSSISMKNYGVSSRRSSRRSKSSPGNKSRRRRMSRGELVLGGGRHFLPQS